ncbi:hypothetical protein ACSETI_23365 [Pseudomonas aeruginosa]
MSKELNKAPVEQAGGDERAAFEAWWQSAEVLKCKQDVAMEAWQARAALAQPSQAPTEGFTHFPELLESVQQMDAMLKANSAQAEAERPEVVARVVHSNPVVLGQCGPLNANDELMTVAQHAASVARWAEMFNRVEQERDAAQAEVERLTRDRDDCLKARLHYATQLGEALARVAELENQEPVAHLRASDLERLNQPGIAGSAGSLWNGPREGFVPLYAAPVAQAQHSVPEEFSFEYRHPNGECHTVTVSREQVINEMPDFLFEALCSKFCNCEPVGETNVVECCCDEYAEEFKLIAAAPGNSAQHSVPEASEQEKEQGWNLDYRFVERVTDLAASRTEYTTSMEATEQVLLAARELLAAAPGKEGL